MTGVSRREHSRACDVCLLSESPSGTGASQCRRPATGTREPRQARTRPNRRARVDRRRGSAATEMARHYGEHGQPATTSAGPAPQDAAAIAVSSEQARSASRRRRSGARHGQPRRRAGRLGDGEGRRDRQDLANRAGEQASSAAARGTETAQDLGEPRPRAGRPGGAGGLRPGRARRRIRDAQRPPIPGDGAADRRRGRIRRWPI